METFIVHIGILFMVFVILIVSVVFRSDAATSDKADAPAKSVTEADTPVDKTRDRMAMQKHISARKAELQAKRILAKCEKREAVQMIPSLESPSLEGPSLEIPSSEAPAKHRQQAPVQQPEWSAASSSADRNDWMEGFDIRRAVVWSEILRPKFKEDEA